MSIRSRLKSGVPGISDREISDLLDWKQNKSQVGKLERNINLQRVATQLLLANPGIVRAIGRADDSPAQTVIRALQMVQEPAGAKTVAKALGGTGRESHDEILAYVGQGLGASNIAEFKRTILEPLRAAELTDELAIRMEQRGIESRIASGRKDEEMPLDERSQDKVSDNYQRRAELENAWLDAERKVPSSARRKADLVDAASDREVDIRRAWAAVHDEPLEIDPESRGAQMWSERHKPETALGNMVLEKKVREAEEVAGRVRAERAYDKAVEDSTMETPLGAAVVAVGGDEMRPEVESIERRYREE